MHNLLNFIIKHSAWILITIYVVVSCALLFSRNPYQHSVYLTSANSISSGVFRIASNVTAYFNLREINEDLQHRNSELEMELMQVKSQLQAANDKIFSDTAKIDESLSRYSFVPAHVINNSIHHSNNYITIDKGELDGISPQMGVVDQNGVVGIVNVVGKHSSRVISVLNSRFQLSCKIKGSAQVGSLIWDGKNSREAVIEGLPRHAEFNRGDTIVTSGFSNVFPEGVPVGIIENTMKDYDENFYALRIKLFTDFYTLSTVRVVKDYLREELEMLEETDEKETR